MNQKEINKRNEILAKFLDFDMKAFEIHELNEVSWMQEEMEGTIEDLKFNDDYNWLMKVWDKIESIPERFGYLPNLNGEGYIHIYDMDKSQYISGQPFKRADKESRKEAMFICFSDFAEWYFKQKKQTK